MKAMELLPPSDTMYRALVNRDSSFEGIFFVGVRTTGIFCRPTCSAKKPARMNVDFFATPSEALHGGYRPCLRCRPMDPGERPPKLIEQLRAEVERAPGGRLTDKELAALSIDPSTARRQFKRHYGMTFQAYHRARRMGLALREVRKGGRVDEAQNGSGFESASGFREAFTRIFGDPPTAAKSRACMFAERIDTPLGAMLAVADDNGLRLLEFADRRALENELATLRQRLKTNVVPGEHQYLDAIRQQLARYFSGENLEFDIPLAPIGSDAHLGALALDTDSRDAFLFLDGGTPRHSERASRCRPRQRHEHALDHHTLSSCHSRRWIALRLRRRTLAKKMAARSRAEVEEMTGDGFLIAKSLSS
jgi:AraC family transcriptional regulator of adaptative response/methylated-DNA-[protein]-cysteine methyltransferase